MGTSSQAACGKCCSVTDRDSEMQLYNENERTSQKRASFLRQEMVENAINEWDQEFDNLEQVQDLKRQDTYGSEFSQNQTTVKRQTSVKISQLKATRPAKPQQNVKTRPELSRSGGDYFDFSALNGGRKRYYLQQVVKFQGLIRGFLTR